MDKNLIQRTISGIVYVAVIILCATPLGAQLINTISPDLVKQQYLYYGLITFLMLVGSWECVKIMKFGKGYEKWVVFPVIAVIFYMFSKRYFYHDFFFDFRLSEILALSLIGIAVVTLFKYPTELYYDSGKLIFTVIYVALPFSFALGLPKYSNFDNSFSLEVLFLFILIWSSDTFAYLTGKFFGKHKMAPKISPKKTWEGYAGGVILTLVLSYFIEKYQHDLRGNWIVVGFLVASFAPLGDLVESQLKRSFGVKDSGNIIPGHGGVLDRLDSFIICVPVVYLYFILEKFI
ncbi:MULTISPECIES: phosphatidate cytidylyltransferase [Chryseobacterium]|uniref:phosphatidate cytidylyltransferase n=1 Tax=Chryseobacterium TaxID=59732 RepID=UPI002359A73A|nr:MULTISPECIES: phosphatidate cytidylyltransferase [unclassified Chryseobacterium]MDC8106257.1 phosphatidate cytidylyltransferase [Chryseobacterium sp. B21-037]MDQ1804763.1 phosphatidate cytidylyltransferase [Chryseobacterium sp. CKR4-1]WBV55477.1 phosphatidate cytidylyltransferase [Chryseobacterium daecheongense]